MNRLALLLAASLLAPGAVAAQVNRVGNEFQVNTYTTSFQAGLSVASSASGDFVVVWESGRDGSSGGVFAQRFSSAGLPLAAEFQVNTYTTNYQADPSVASSASGDFVVAWGSIGQDGNDYGVFARRFSSAGVALGVEFQVNTYTSAQQRFPAVTTSSGGDFVIAWASQQDGASTGVFAQRFSSTGLPLAGEFQVNTHTPGYQTAASVSAFASGDFVVVWESTGAQDGNGNGIFARRFSSAGVAFASEFQVNSYTMEFQRYPAVTASSDGNFTVAWESGYDQDGDKFGIFARRFSSSGVAVTGEIPVNTYATSNQRFPSVASDASGDFIVAWQSNGQDGAEFGIFARRFSGAGAALTDELQANTYTPFAQIRAAVGASASGGFVVAWQSFNQDGSAEGGFAQLFAVPILLDVDGNGSTGALTDGLLLLRYLFGFRGAILINGVVDLGGCTRCDAPSIEAYLAAHTG